MIPSTIFTDGPGWHAESKARLAYVGKSGAPRNERRKLQQNYSFSQSSHDRRGKTKEKGRQDKALAEDSWITTHPYLANNKLDQGQSQLAH